MGLGNPAANPDWVRDCQRWRGRTLTGKHAHWCCDWDFLPIDETTPEWPCPCAESDGDEVYMMHAFWRHENDQLYDGRERNGELIYGHVVYWFMADDRCVAHGRVQDEETMWELFESLFGDRLDTDRKWSE